MSTLYGNSASLELTNIIVKAAPPTIPTFTDETGTSQVADIPAAIGGKELTAAMKVLGGLVVEDTNVPVGSGGHREAYLDSAGVFLIVASPGLWRVRTDAPSSSTVKVRQYRRGAGIADVPTDGLVRVPEAAGFALTFTDSTKVPTSVRLFAERLV